MKTFSVEKRDTGLFVGVAITARAVVGAVGAGNGRRPWRVAERRTQHGLLKSRESSGDPWGSSFSQLYRSLIPVPYTPLFILSIIF